MRYGLALLTVGFVVFLALRVEEEPRVPAWLSDDLVPGLAWLFLGLLALRLLGGCLSKARERSDGRPKRSDDPNPE